MDYERRFKYQENIPTKERQYTYYITDLKNLNENNKETSPSKYYNNNNLISNHMRISNIESRLTTMEKMIKYFDEFLHLKEEEKMNNLNSLELSQNIPMNVNDLVTKIDKLEKKLDLVQKQKQQSDIEHEKIIQNLSKKIEYLENLINSNNISQNINNKKIYEEENNNINENTNKQNNNNIKLGKNFTLNPEIEQYNNLDNKISEIDEIIKNKLDEIYSNNKINEMLSLIEDINKVSEENEFNINEQNENIRKIQNDNLTLIKVVAVHSEKINSIDYIMNELTNLKNKYFKLLTLANKTNNNEIDDEKYQNEINEKLEEENNNQNENNNIQNDNQNNNNINNI